MKGTMKLKLTQYHPRARKPRRVRVRCVRERVEEEFLDFDDDFDEEEGDGEDGHFSLSDRTQRGDI